MNYQEQGIGRLVAIALLSVVIVGTIAFTVAMAGGVLGSAG